MAYFPEQGEGRLWDRSADPRKQHDLFENASVAESNVTILRAKMGLLTALLRWRAQQDPIAFLDANLQPDAAAPTAKIVVNHTQHIRGIDAEIRLQEDALKFEPGYGGTRNSKVEL